MTKPLYFYNGTTFELVGPTTPQSPIAYQTSAPTAPATGDLWIDSDGDVDTYNRQLTRYYFVATASQTTITGVDANGLTLAYVAGSEAVYVNGALQVRGQDYTATNGTSVVMSSGLAVNDVVEIFAYTAFTVANAYTKSETDSVAAAAAGLRLVVPTSVAVGSGTGSVSAVGVVTFSGASNVSVNGCFNSTYDYYKVLFNFLPSASTDHSIQFRASGTNATTNYTYSGTRTNGSTTTVFTASGNEIYFTSGSGAVNKSYSVEIFDVAKAASTRLISAGVHEQSLVVNMTGYHTTATAYDGFTFFTATGTMTGTIQIYGYKD